MKQNLADRLRLLVTAIGVLLVGVGLIWANIVWVPERYQEYVTFKWLRFAAVTISFVVVCMKVYWRAQKRLSFWVVLLAILSVHVIGIGYFFYFGSGLPSAVFAGAVGLEAGLFVLAIHYFRGIAPSV